jgi:hypothetical protein
MNIIGHINEMIIINERYESKSFVIAVLAKPQACVTGVNSTDCRFRLRPTTNH